MIPIVCLFDRIKAGAHFVPVNSQARSRLAGNQRMAYFLFSSCSVGKSRE
jgi:hypothetical protein